MLGVATPRATNTHNSERLICSTAALEVPGTEQNPSAPHGTGPALEEQQTPPLFFSPALAIRKELTGNSAGGTDFLPVAPVSLKAAGGYLTKSTEPLKTTFHRTLHSSRGIESNAVFPETLFMRTNPTCIYDRKPL